jgi:hypothetical protein
MGIALREMTRNGQTQQEESALCAANERNAGTFANKYYMRLREPRTGAHKQQTQIRGVEAVVQYSRSPLAFAKEAHKRMFPLLLRKSMVPFPPFFKHPGIVFIEN